MYIHWRRKERSKEKYKNLRWFVSHIYNFLESMFSQLTAVTEP
jgi:predicted secreted protein